MKTYYFEMNNGDTDFVEAANDRSAYARACKIAKKQFSEVAHLYETFEETEIDRKIFLNLKSRQAAAFTWVQFPGLPLPGATGKI